MKKYIIVSEVSEVKKDKGAKGENRSYKTIEFSTPDRETMKDELTGDIFAVKVQPKKTSINLYEKSYLDDKMQFGYDSAKGERLAGDIVTRQVAPYSIPTMIDGKEAGSRMVNTFTTAVLGDTESGPAWEAAIRNTFKNRGHELSTSNTPMNFSIASSEESAVEVASKELVK